jgi:hypothetical protein
LTSRTLTRRIAIGALAAAAAVLAVRELRLLPRHAYRKSPYDDVFSQLDDRDAAARFGRPLLASDAFEPAGVAASIRQELKGTNLKALATEDASRGRVLELAGWIVPRSLALLCALAAAEA